MLAPPMPCFSHKLRLQSAIMSDVDVQLLSAAFVNRHVGRGLIGISEEKVELKLTIRHQKHHSDFATLFHMQWPP